MSAGEMDDAGGRSELVMVGRFRDPVEAQMARGMLESQGIECVLQGVNANAVMPLAFRVRLEVMQQDVNEARMLLEEVELGLMEHE